MKKKVLKIILTIITIFILIILNQSVFAVTSNANQKNLKISNIINVGGSGLGNYSTIQEALDASTDGDTVFVYSASSPYNECIEIEKKISLMGEDKETTKIIGGSTRYVISVENDDIIIRGFTIQKADNQKSYPWEGIYVEYRYDNIKIIDNIISDFEYGIYLGSNCCEIKDNYFYNCGVYMSPHNSDNELSNNYVNDKELLYLELEFNKEYYDVGQVILIDCNNIKVENSEISNLYEGILLGNSHECSFKNIKLTDSTIYLSESNNNIFENIESNIDYGRTNLQRNAIRLLQSDENEFYHSNISSITGHGFHISDSNGNIIENNNIEQNGIGISIIESRSNKVRKNNFIKNIKSAYFLDAKLNTFSKNYWGRPRFIKVILGSKTIVEQGFMNPPVLIPAFKIELNSAKKPFEI